MLDLLLVGHVSRDRIVGAAGDERIATGGAVFYGSLPARLLGARTGVLTKLAEADRALLDELVAAGVELHLLPSERSTAIQNIARSADGERRRFVVAEVAAPFRVEEILAIEARVVLVCALQRGEVPEDALPAIARARELALDAQGFVRCREGDALVSRPWPEAAASLRQVSFLKVDRREAEILTGEPDARHAIERLAALGPREVLVTGGESILLACRGRIEEAALEHGEVRGRTGRGDTAIASYLACRLRGDEPAAALRTCAWVVSRKLEQPGPFRGPLP
jgi:sugar/nucleoside kinase (ribokinase family)